MTPAQIKQARQSLGLSQSQLAAMLDTDPRAIRAMESDPSTSKHRTPAPRMVRLLQAYLDGYRPDDWPIQDGNPPPYVVIRGYKGGQIYIGGSGGAGMAGKPKG